MTWQAFATNLQLYVIGSGGYNGDGYASGKSGSSIIPLPVK